MTTKNKKNKNSASIFPESIFDSQLDFHDFGVIDIYEIEKYLIEFIEDCYLKNYKKVLIIVGKGRVVRPIVKEKLKTIQCVESFRQAGYFNGGDGAFEIVLRA